MIDVLVVCGHVFPNFLILILKEKTLVGVPRNFWVSVVFLELPAWAMKRDRASVKAEEAAPPTYREVTKEEWFKTGKDDEPDEVLLEDSSSDEVDGSEADGPSDDGDAEDEDRQTGPITDLQKLQEWVRRYDPPNEEESEDETHNTVGKVPMQWYSEYPHIGYNLKGEKIIKKDRKDQIQQFIDRSDDPNYWFVFLQILPEGGERGGLRRRQ